MDSEAKDRTAHVLRGLMAGIEQILPGHAVVLLVAPKGPVADPRANYIANAQREDMIAMMKEVAARLEGRGHDAPAMRQ